MKIRLFILLSLAFLFTSCVLAPSYSIGELSDPDIVGSSVSVSGTVVYGTPSSYTLQDESGSSIRVFSTKAHAIDEQVTTRGTLQFSTSAGYYIVEKGAESLAPTPSN